MLENIILEKTVIENTVLGTTHCSKKNRQQYRCVRRAPHHAQVARSSSFLTTRLVTTSWRFLGMQIMCGDQTLAESGTYTCCQGLVPTHDLHPGLFLAYHSTKLTQTSSCCGICTPPSQGSPKYMAKGRGENLVFEVQKQWPQRLWKAMFGGVEGAGVRVEGAGGRGSISKLGQSE